MTLPPRLSARLAAVAGLVLADEPAADVGTDHGMLPVHLLLSGRVPRAIAMDLRPSPLNNARRLAERSGLGPPALELRLSDGLAALAPGEAASLAVCGMGAGTIREILASDPEKAASLRRLVLQPNDDAERLRRWLVASGWDLVAEALIEEDGRFYPVIAAERGEAPPCDAADYAFGPLLRRAAPPALGRWLAREQARLRRLLQQAQAAADPADPDRARLQRRADLIDAELARLG